MSGAADATPTMAVVVTATGATAAEVAVTVSSVTSATSSPSSTAGSTATSMSPVHEAAAVTVPSEPRAQPASDPASATASTGRAGPPTRPVEVVILDAPPELDPPAGSAVATSWTEADADVIVLARAGGRVAPGAFDALAEVLGGDDEVDLVYVDDVARASDDSPELADPVHRPGFSPDRLRAQMYLGELVAVRRSVAAVVDPEGTELRSPLAHHHAVALTAACRAVAHLPRLLYHRSGAPHPRPEPTVVDGLNAELEAAGFAGRVTVGHDVDAARTAPPVLGVVPRLGRHPLVSIVVPTVGTMRRVGRPGSDDEAEVRLITQSVASVLRRSTYPHYEVVVITTPGTPRAVVGELRSVLADHRADRNGAGAAAVRLRHDDRPFNFANAANRGATVAAGEVLVFLNDDTVVHSPDWIERLVMYAGHPEIGAVGARLVYGDGRVQHVGIWTRGGHPAHRYERFAPDHPGYQAALLVPQNCLATTGACLAVEAAKFDEVGGFSPLFPSSYNDVDLCLKLTDAGYRTVIDPGTELTHLEAASRDPGVEDWELAALHERWRSLVNADPFDNPNHLAPGSDEHPPPDPMLTERRQRAGRAAAHPPRRWPPAPLSGLRDRRPTPVPAGATAARSGGERRR